MSLPADRLAPRAAAALGLGAVLGWARYAALASGLRVVPQAGQHLGPGPDAAHLDLLDRAFQVACAAMRPGRPGRLEALRPRDAALAPWRRPVSAHI